MNEMQLLNNTLEMIDDKGIKGAYNYLVSNLEELESLSSQVYNYLYCLASCSEKKEEAINWLNEAIVKKGFWYRPEVFEDDDLDNIRHDDRFKVYCNLSNERYMKALETAQTKCTWSRKSRKDIVLALHGNQQNIDICRENWDFLKDYSYQVEYLQSMELDSYQLFRWEDKGNGPSQLEKEINKIDWESYDNKILCGFSAGCNVILRGIMENDIDCDKIILQSPWIPVISEKIEEVVEILSKKNISILIVCGEDDEDCIDLSKKFAEEAAKKGVKIGNVFIKNLGHDFPSNFSDIVTEFI